MNEWSVTEKLLLRQGWQAGKSASEISLILLKAGYKRTRNAVIGRAHRLNLTAREAPKELAQYAKRLKAKKAPPKLEPGMSETDQGISTFDLSEDTCRWMVGKHRYCGCQVLAGSPYCSEHDAQAFVPARKKISVHPYHLG